MSGEPVLTDRFFLSGRGQLLVVSMKEVSIVLTPFNPPTYIQAKSYPHRGTMRDGWSPLLISVLLSQSEINLHSLHSSEPALRNDAIFVGYDVL